MLGEEASYASFLTGRLRIAFAPQSSRFIRGPDMMTSDTAPERSAKSPRGSFTIPLYLIVTGLSAACGLVIEIVAGRMIAPYLGMSLYTWTAVIAVVLAGFTAGHWVGGWLAGKPAADARRGVIISLFLAGLTAALSLVLIRALSGPVITMGLSPVPTILILTTALFFLPSFFVGIPSPALTKLAIDEAPERMGRLLGAFYAVGAFGSIAGTLAAGYFFISYLGSIRTILTVAVLYCAMAAAIFAVDRRLSGAALFSRGSAASLLAAVALIGGVLIWGRGVRAFVEPCTKESAYYCIRVVDITRDLGLPARTMVLDHLGHGTNLRDRPDIYLTPYVEAQDVLVRAHFPEQGGLQAFFIGGGAFTLPRGWLADPQGRFSAVTVAEIDPEVTETAREAFWLAADNRLQVRHIDARRALADEPEGRFQIVVGDAFHDIAVPQHLVTREFFALVKSRMSEGGVYVMNVIDGETSPRLALSIRRTLLEAFPVVELWRPAGQGERQTFVIIAAERETPLRRVSSRVDPDANWTRVDAEALDRLSTSVETLVLTDDFAPVDRLIAVE